MADELCAMGVLELAREYRQGKLSPVEVVRAHLERCTRLNPVLNAFLCLLNDSAMESARSMESLFKAGVDLGPLQGVPVTIKDLIQVQGTKTTAGSRVLLTAPPDAADALVVRRLRAGGAVIIGKTNLHEFAAGDPEPEGPFGLVQNPRRVGCHPGSSSSGAGAAAATGLGVIGMGTDTGGSIRIPASLCGVAGIKPTTGWISLEGIVPLSDTLDAVGPLARRASDLAAALGALAEGCPGLPAAHCAAADLEKSLERNLRGWRVGLPQGDFFSNAQPAVVQALARTREVLGELDCQFFDFDPPGIAAIPELTLTIIRAESAACHEKYRGKEQLYGPSFRERILAGREVKALDYLHARRRQSELQQDWLELMNRCDLLIAPTTPSVAPPHGASTIEVGGEAVPFRELLGRFTRPFNLLGWPAVSLPNGMDEQGLPTGVQIAGPPGSEARLLVVAHQLEKRLGLVDRLGIEPQTG